MVSGRLKWGAAGDGKSLEKLLDFAEGAEPISFETDVRK
jgi:hypothetical protein